MYSITLKHTPEEKVWFTSDLHLGHDKEFVWKARGFKSVGEMNETIIKNIKKRVGENDYLYILGDLALCPLVEAKYWLAQIPGKVHVIVGNHDTDIRLGLYDELGFTWSFANRMKYEKYHFFLSHYPTLTANPGEDKLTLAHINLYGHTHTDYTWETKFPFSYHVGCDAHLCCPISLDDIILDLKENLDMKQHGLI
jgi:calcineurin-like phosphoesterase family protein